MPKTNYLKNTKGLTSTQAAALQLTDGRTDDAKLANRAAEVDFEVGQSGFYFDALDKDHLVKTIGFPFDVSIKHKKLTVYSKQEPFVSKAVNFSGDMNEKTVDKLVTLCLDVKKLYEDAKESGQDGNSKTTSNN